MAVAPSPGADLNARGLNRVVVTGVGAVTPMGGTAESSWEGFLAGRSGAVRLEELDLVDLERSDVRIAAPVREFDPAEHMPRKAARRMARFAQLAVAAAGEALGDAGLTIGPGSRDRVAVVMHTGGGGLELYARAVLQNHLDGPDGVSPFTVPMVSPNMAACQISIAYGITGPVVASVAACASGLQALVDAARMLRLGEVDAVVAGGTEALLGLSLIAFARMGVLSRRNGDPEGACRPFDLERDGCVMGEGSAALVLETEQHAARRGARVLCELRGAAATGDAFHLTIPAPDGDGAARAMRGALDDADLDPGAVDYICAHGSATRQNDVSETTAIKTVFGDHAYRIPVSSTKSMTGHLLGAAGAISAVASVLALRDGVVPGTLNLTARDPECDLDYVADGARRVPRRAVMVNAFGFGGQNAVTILTTYPE